MRASCPARRSPALPRFRASYGRMRERSAGKDTTTGHWEIAGVILEEPFATFQRFPEELVRQIEHGSRRALHRQLCARAAQRLSRRLGEQHLQTGNPILYTSADSVLQIAAHEEIVPLARLYEICQVARRAADPYRIGRIIARPFRRCAGKFSAHGGPTRLFHAPPTYCARRAGRARHPGRWSWKNQRHLRRARNHSVVSDRVRIEPEWRRSTSCGAPELTVFIFANLVDFDSAFRSPPRCRRLRQRLA